MKSMRSHYLAATILTLWCAPAVAQTAPTTDEPAASDRSVRRSVSYIDLTAGVGYSSNPFLGFSNSQDSAFGRLGIRGVHAWTGERGSTTLTGFAEGTSYFNEYDLKSIFSLTADTRHEASEKVTVFANAGISGDLSGQLSNRFLYVPPVPDVPDATLPPPPETVQDPDLFSFAGRQYRLFGQAGAAIRTSARSNLQISGGASRVWFSDSLLNDYTTVFGDTSYNRFLSERTTVGASVRVEQTSYDDSNDHSTLINPMLTMSTRLSEFWDFDGGIGVVFSNFDRDGDKSHNVGLSLNAGLCHSSETERLCGRIARTSQSLSRGALVNTTSANVDWYKKLDDKQTLQLSAGVSRYVSEDDLTSGFKSYYLRAAGSYSRKINNRLSGGADVSVRTLRAEGPDPDADFSGSLFLRYRLGDMD